MKTIGICNVKGGSGKTSAAVPLAAHAALSDPTLLLDMDPSPSASRWVKLAELDLPGLASYQVGREGLNEMLSRGERASMRWAVIDTPSVMRDIALEVMLVSDLVLVPMHIGSGDMDNLVETMKLLVTPRRLRPELRVLVVLNHTGNMKAVTRRTRLTVAEAGLQVAETEIPFRASYAEAKGQPPAGEHYPRLWDEILEVLA